MRTLFVKRELLDWIIQGLKDLEVRSTWGFIKTIRAGECILLADSTREIIVEVIAVRTYPSFSALLEKEDPQRIAPGHTAEQILAVLLRLYEKEKEAVVLEIRISSRQATSS